MKNHFYILILSILTLSCSGKKDNGDNNNNTISVSDSIQNAMDQELRLTHEKWQKNLKGTWYNQVYFDNLKNFRSPYTLFNNAPEIIGFNVNKPLDFNQKKITFPAFNIHEGGFFVNFTIVENQLFFSYPSDSKIQYKVMDITENELLFEHPNSGQIFSYIRKENFGQAVGETLMEGTFLIVETGKTITFQKQGKVTNWPEFTHYNVPFDYVGLADFDILMLTKTPKPTIDDYTLYKAIFGQNEVTLTKYIADWTNLDHQETDEKLHLRKK